jgi:hypothetical protein
MFILISKRFDRIDLSLPSPDDGNRSSFEDILISDYLEFRTTDEVNKPSDPELRNYTVA